MTDEWCKLSKILQAGNDPIAPAKAIPYEAIRDNPNCMLAVTPTGGHLGWVSGPGAPLGQFHSTQLTVQCSLHAVSNTMCQRIVWNSGRLILQYSFGEDNLACSETQHTVLQ